MELLQTGDIPVDTSSFNELRIILHEQAGITLNESKLSLVSARLRRRISELGHRSLGEYVSFLRSISRSHGEWQVFINAMTTNKTSFFRESPHFDLMIKDVLPELTKNLSGRQLNVWSAACSTGEEPYSLAMLLRDEAQRAGFEFRVTGTDIDTGVLEHARNGVYRHSLLQAVPEKYLRGAVMRGSGDIASWSKIRDEIKTNVAFRQLNLTKPPYPWREHFDVIFCRNVLIYFDAATIEKVAGALYEAARPGAWLFTGHTESLQNIRTPWKFVAPSIYRKLRG